MERGSSPRMTANLRQEQRIKRMAIEVAKVELKNVQDASGLEAASATANSTPTRSSP